MLAYRVESSRPCILHNMPLNRCSYTYRLLEFKLSTSDAALHTCIFWLPRIPARIEAPDFQISLRLFGIRVKVRVATRPLPSDVC